MPSVGYVAYIDEAGDDGLYGGMRPDDPRGASEWISMSAVVVRVDNERNTVQWVKDLVAKLEQPQLTHLHFRRLRENKKALVCNEMAKLPLRCFTVLSHKRNMKGYTNLAAEQAKVNRTAWFFCWLSRLLLERVTSYCSSRTLKDYGEVRSVKIEFSDRGGVNIDDIKDYYRYISKQSQMGLLYLSTFDLSWDVMDVEMPSIHPNRMRAGLQLADIVASTFYQAVELTAEGIVRPTPATLLSPVVCRRRTGIGVKAGFSLKVMPTWISSVLRPDQRAIIDFYANQ